jgi:hypothetical protein
VRKNLLFISKTHGLCEEVCARNLANCLFWMERNEQRWNFRSLRIKEKEIDIQYSKICIVSCIQLAAESLTKGMSISSSSV